MKKIVIIIIISIAWNCSSTKSVVLKPSSYIDMSEKVQSDTLTRIFHGDTYELSDTCGYVNQYNDTIIPIGRYTHCFKDTVVNFAIVNVNDTLIAIDQNENKLYDIYVFDNGPDYTQDGLFRILRNGKIGYADKSGKVIIEPQYNCAFPFKGGKAKVTYKCNQDYLKKESKKPKRSHWFYIDKKGERTRKPKD